MDWRTNRKVKSFSENVFQAYFGELSEKYKPPSLWAHYSMFRSTVDLNNDNNRVTYFKLYVLLTNYIIYLTMKEKKNDYELNY